MDTHITVAIDGPSGAGKSTIARAAARRFGLIYVDTGAIYRTVGLAGERAGVNCSDADAMQALLPTLRIELVYDAAGSSGCCSTERTFRIRIQSAGGVTACLARVGAAGRARVPA